MENKTPAMVILLHLVCLVAALVCVGVSGVSAGGVASEPEAPYDTPVIGVMAQNTYKEISQFGDQYVFASYVKWLQAAGARVVVVRGYQPARYYQDLFHLLNGFLLPGGKVDVVTSESTRVARMFYDWAVQANDKGNYFPIWATCQGFEQLTVLATGANLLERTDSEDLALPLNFTDYGLHGSRLLSKAPRDILDILQREDVTANYHDWSLTTKTWKSTDYLSTFYNVISTNVDRNNENEFVSTIEAKQYPFYGVQYHPEMNVYAWKQGLAIKRTSNAIKVAQYLANFFIDEARKSSNRGASYEEIASIIAENDPLFYFKEEMRPIYAYNVSKDITALSPFSSHHKTEGFNNKNLHWQEED